MTSNRRNILNRVRHILVANSDAHAVLQKVPPVTHLSAATIVGLVEYCHLSCSGRSALVPEFIAQKLENSSTKFSLVVGIAVLILYSIGIASYPLVDPDEPVYGQVAKEMATGGGWLTPHYEGKDWFDKPPLYYWLSGICACELGPNSEAASRLPSVIFGAGLVLLVLGVASREFGRRAGLFSALAIGTCIQQIVLAHSAVTDMTFVFFLTSAVFAYRRWFLAEGRARIGWAVAAGLLGGLATLTKGPVAPVLLFTAFLIDLWIAGRLKRLYSCDVLAGIASLIVVALPWYLVMYVLHRDEFVQGFLVANNITRFLRPEHASQTGNWTSYFRNFGVLLLFFFPWSGFLPQAIKFGWRRNDCLRLCTIWATVVFVFFSISKTQLVTYIFPLYPAAAILIGYLWSSAASGDSKALRSIRGGLVFNCVIGLLLGAALAIISKSKFPGLESAGAGTGLTLGITVVVSMIWALRRRKENAAGAIWILSGGMTAFMLVLMLAVAPKIGPYVSTHSIVNALPDGSSARIAQYGCNAPSLLFYMGKMPTQLTSIAEATQFLSRPEPALLICRRKITPDMSGSLLFGGGKWALIANKPAAYLKELNNAR